MKAAITLILATGTVLSAHPDRDWKVGYDPTIQHGRDGTSRMAVTMPEPSSLIELSMGGIAVVGLLLMRKRA